MIYLIACETEANKRNAMTGRVGTKLEFEKMSGDPCLVRWFTEVSLEEVRRCGVKAIFVAGFGTDIQKIPRKNWKALTHLLHNVDVPVIGTCGGHQVIGCAFGGDPWYNYPMRKLRRGEPDIAAYNPGMFKEWGFYEVTRLRDDPLFDGLGRKFVVAEYHYCEVRKVPPGFDLIATNDNCRVQGIRHRSRPVYGTQFHWESFTDNYPDGKRIMANFLRIAGYKKLDTGRA